MNNFYDRNILEKTQDMTKVEVIVDGYKVMFSSADGIQYVSVQCMKLETIEDNPIKENIGSIVIKGRNLSGIMQEGLTYKINGIKTNSTRGPVVEVESKAIVEISIEKNTYVEILKHYFEGMGKVSSEKLVNIYGKDIFKEIEKRNITHKTLKNLYIKDSYNVHKKMLKKYEEIKHKINELIYFMEKGMTVHMAEKIIRYYREDIIKKYEEDPYDICNIEGIGFIKADKFTDKSKFGFKSIERRKAAIMYSLDKGCYDGGHTYLDKDSLLESLNLNTSYKIGLNELSGCMKRNSKIKIYGAEFEITKDILKQYNLYKDMDKTSINDKPIIVASYTEEEFIEGLEELDLCCKVVLEEDRIYSQKLHAMEEFLVSFIKGYRHSKFESYNKIELEKHISYFEEFEGYSLEDKQKEAVHKALNGCGILGITGPAGSGKTTITKCILHKLNESKKSFMLLAPTGKASKVLEGATGEESKTIHRGLEWTTEGFKYDSKNKLDYQFIVVDESTMKDLELSWHLFQAIDIRKTRLILLGDINQLPSVGPGRVFQDILDIANTGKYHWVQAVYLDKVKRQNSLSGIVEEANNVLNGKIPKSRPDTHDVTVKFIADNKEMEDRVLKTYKAYLDRGITPDEIQVLSNLYKGESGVDSLNSRIQKLYNPLAKEMSKKQKFMVNDKVINIKNNYNGNNVEIINGKYVSKDISMIPNGETGIYSGKFSISHIINFESGLYFMDTSEIYNVELAYAISTHKSQGSAFDHVIVVLKDSNSTMVNRNILYTAMTRARKSLIIYAKESTLRRAVAEMKAIQRNSKVVDKVASL